MTAQELFRAACLQMASGGGIAPLSLAWPG